jgi:hypothetical protein
MSRMGFVLVASVLGVGGCDNFSDLVIDGSVVAEAYPDARFIADFIVDGASVLHVDIALDETPVFRADDALDVRVLYGVAAYADVDGDGACSPFPADLPWYFYYQPGLGDTFQWVLDPGEAPEMGDACTWFGEGTLDPGLPGDTSAG